MRQSLQQIILYPLPAQSRRISAMSHSLHPATPNDPTTGLRRWWGAVWLLPLLTVVLNLVAIGWLYQSQRFAVTVASLTAAWLMALVAVVPPLVRPGPASALGGDLDCNWRPSPRGFYAGRPLSAAGSGAGDGMVGRTGAAAAQHGALRPHVALSSPRYSRKSAATG